MVSCGCLVDSCCLAGVAYACWSIEAPKPKLRVGPPSATGQACCMHPDCEWKGDACKLLEHEATCPFLAKAATAIVPQTKEALGAFFEQVQPVDEIRKVILAGRRHTAKILQDTPKPCDESDPNIIPHMLHGLATALGAQCGFSPSTPDGCLTEIYRAGGPLEMEVKFEHKELSNWEEYRKRLAQVHGVHISKVRIIGDYTGTYNLKYTVDDLTEAYKNDILSGKLEAKMKQNFKEFMDLKVHPAALVLNFDPQDFDVAGKKNFENGITFDNVGGEKYKQPKGWSRIGMKVLDKYPEGNEWLHPFQHKDNWTRAYAGIARNAHNEPSEVGKIAKNIFEAGFLVSPAGGCTGVLGAGVYTTPDVEYAKYYSAKIPLQMQEGLKKFYVAYQLAIRPGKITKRGKETIGARWCKDPEVEWLVPKTVDVRAYGLLLKECRGGAESP